MMLFPKVLLGVVFFVFCVLCIVWDTPLLALEEALHEMGMLAYVAYVVVLTIAVVCMPVTVMPLIPVAAMVLGPLATALLSIVGWTVGGSVAFLIARYLGRPLLQKLVSLDHITSIEDKIPVASHIWLVILLRLTMPVDLVSYALGMTQTLTFWSYFIGTLVGVTWFSFAFAYMGEALLTGNTFFLLELGLPSLGVFLLAYYILRKLRSDK